MCCGSAGSLIVPSAITPLSTSNRISRTSSGPPLARPPTPAGLRERGCPHERLAALPAERRVRSMAPGCQSASSVQSVEQIYSLMLCNAKTSLTKCKASHAPRRAFVTAHVYAHPVSPEITPAQDDPRVQNPRGFERHLLPQQQGTRTVAATEREQWT